MESSIVANQYTENFKNTLEAKHNKPLAEILRDYAEKGFNYLEVARLTGFKHGTVRKWAKVSGVILKPVTVFAAVEVERERCAFFESLKMSQINSLNVLSRRWVA
jgi:hypothetical protein